MTAAAIPQATRVREVTLHHYDGSWRTVRVTDIETPFPKGRLIISHSDTEGVITHANQFLTQMCAYKESELIGKPHNILRHPDMPPILFKEMWDTIKQGKIWQGGVKNLRKDGGFYWVDAVISPNTRGGKIIGYISVRNELSRDKREACELLYPTLF
jgi:aerotaxis receptor